MKKKFYNAMLCRTLIVIVFFFSFYFIACGNKTVINSVSNINGAKSLEAIHIVSRYSSQTQELVVMPVSTMAEAAIYGPTTPISFDGQMTAYQANCPGCSGRVGCPPRQDVRNGNIYFNDTTYGNVRILAADPSLPCGTIIQISNVTFSQEPIIGIVLDRGSAIRGNIIDFLIPEVESASAIGRQYNVHYEVLRWGW